MLPQGLGPVVCGSPGSEQQRRTLPWWQGGSGGIELSFGQGQPEGLGIQVHPHRFEIRLPGLIGPQIGAGLDLFRRGKARGGNAGGDMAHRQHQVHLAAAGTVEAELKIGLPN